QNVTSPRRKAPINAIWMGTGNPLGKKLEEKGFDKAYIVLGQFLMLKKAKDLFPEWLKNTCGANILQSRDCYGCLKECCASFF
uniref:Barrier-to-autointegration factor n=1 Tax=Varanus komodoensis TaxID=61221 RepID=A0A8D2J3K1_VARKO